MYFSASHSLENNQHSNFDEELSQTHHLPEEIRVYYSPETDNVYSLAGQETPAKFLKVQDSQYAMAAENQPQSNTNLNYFYLTTPPDICITSEINFVNCHAFDIVHILCKHWKCLKVFMYKSLQIIIFFFL